MLKYVYILVSDNTDYYYEQALISITSLKNKTHDAFVFLLTDDITELTLTGKRAGILRLADEFKAISIDGKFNKKARSRYLKTAMRRLIGGDFLYIDCDTVIAEDLSEIADWDGDLGAVFDEHGDLTVWAERNPRFLKEKQELDKKLDFSSSIKSNSFFNGGVIFCRDTPLVREFFNKWHKLWLYCFENGILIDQQSFNQANYEFNGIIKALDGNWNCQIFCDGGIAWLHTAKIIHYFTTVRREKVYKIADQEIFEKIRETGVIGQETGDMLMNPKSQFTANARLIYIDKIQRNFTNSALYNTAKNIYFSKIGPCFELLFQGMRTIFVKPLKGFLKKSNDT